MTAFQKLRLVAVTALAIFLGITNGWESGVGLVLGVCLLLGIWEAIVRFTGYDPFNESQEPRTGPLESDWIETTPYRPSDPNVPDEHPLIQIEAYRRHRRELK